jgi:hypothetical protein
MLREGSVIDADEAQRGRSDVLNLVRSRTQPVITPDGQPNLEISGLSVERSALIRRIVFKYNQCVRLAR